MNTQIRHPKLLNAIESFLAATGMGETYFGKKSAKNSEIVDRLRSGGRVWPETEAAVIEFIKDESEKRGLVEGATQ